MIEPGFMVLQGNRLENLRQVAVTWLNRHPLAPLENEILLVQSNGIAQWLKLALAADADAREPGCGIAAALTINLPGRFHWQAYRAVLGDLPETSPYDKQLLSWRLLRLLPTLLNETEFVSLRHFLMDDKGQRKLFQLAQRLADLFDQYQIYRADWLQDWSRDLNRITRHNQHTVLPDEQGWQAALWRRLCQDIGAEARSSGRAQVHKQFLDACRSLTATNRPPGLPRRVVLFGISSLPRQSLEVLAAISRCTQVLLCVHNPCMHYWGDIIEPHVAQQMFARPYQRQPARADLAIVAGDSNIDELFLRANPLLAAWGKQGRDYIRLLDEHDERAAYEPFFRQNKLAIDLFEEPDACHVLGRIQADIFHLRSISEAKTAQTESAATGGLSFHIAHSTQREVEILQDHLLTLFDNNSTLRPRDILVMVPDINQFAPHIQAVFGRIDPADKRYIPFTISDQGKRHQAPVYLALSILMRLTSSRFGVSELLDLMDVSAVQQAFDLDAGDKTLLHRWIDGAGIRWGLNKAQRLAHGLPATLQDQTLEQNTWHFGLRRMLLGYAVGNSDAWQDIEPFAEVGGLSAAIIGKLTRLLNVLEHHWHLFQEQTDIANWTLRISALMRDCLHASDDQDALLIARAEKRLQTWREACEQADFREELGIDIVSDFFLDALDEQELSQRFLAGAVNFATLMPMRAIPFRHICLLGMNDGDYPRQVPAVDFDLMRHDYRPGDRSRREDDRYLFLEALLSARDALYISWSGRSIRDNSERPPSVLVAQLRDYVADTCDQAMLSAITREYPLQPFSEQYFSTSGKHRTFAHEWEPGASSGTEHTAPVFNHPSSENDENTTLTLRDLVSLLRQPANVFFNRQLGIVFDDENMKGEDDELFAIDGLTRWQINNDILNAVQRALVQSAEPSPDIESILNKQINKLARSGVLPLPPFSELERSALHQALLNPLTCYHQVLQTWPEPLDLRIDIPASENSPALLDILSDIHQMPGDAGQRVRCVLFNSQIWAGKKGSRGEPKWHYLVREWPAHLAAQLHGPVTTRLLGPATDEQLAPLDADQAQELLTSLLRLWQLNLQQVLRADVKTSCTYLSTDDLQDPASKAAIVYDGDYNREGIVHQNYALYRLWPTFAELMPESSHSGSASMPSKFVQDSRALYQPLIDHWYRHRRANTDGEDAI